MENKRIPWVYFFKLLKLNVSLLKNNNRRDSSEFKSLFSISHILQPQTIQKTDIPIRNEATHVGSWWLSNRP